MRNRSESGRDMILRWFSFIPAGLVVWTIYDLLMVVLGGRNTGYGPGWNQWNYVRWMLAPNDAVRLGDFSQISWAFWFFPAYVAALGGAWIFMVRTYSRKDYSSSQRLWADILLYPLIPQCPALLVVFHEGGSRFWWPTPHTAIPVPLIWVFEIATTVAYLASPLLIYWFALPIRRLWEKRDRRLLAETPPPEETPLS